MTQVNFKKLEELGQKEKTRQEKYKQRIFCCNSTACLSSGAAHTHTALQQAVVAAKGDEDAVEIVPTGCMGLCSRGPLVRVEAKDEEPLLYGDVSTEVAQQIVAQHLFKQDPDAAQGIEPFDMMHFMPVFSIPKKKRV